MTRRNKKQQESVLKSVFGFDLGEGATPAPNPPEIDPALIAAAATMARAEKLEKLADAAEIRAAAFEAARAAGVKRQSARGFVKLLDLSGVAMNSDGEPDEAEITRIVRAGCEEYPELTTGGR